MQIAKLKIQNFKGIRDLELSFEDELGRIRPLSVLIGDNGSGKTTALQAIALVLSLATKRTSEPALLDWPGFLAERVGSGGSTRVELEVAFPYDEVEAVRAVFHRLHADQNDVSLRVFADPDQLTRVKLIYDDGILMIPNSEHERLLQGRAYVRRLLKTQPGQREMFHRIGDVFWFDQHRNVSTVRAGRTPGIEGLREILVAGWAAHRSTTRDGDSDYIEQIETHFAALFPGTKFLGVKPKAGYTSSTAKDMYFLLERDKRVYDLAEMSSGEQAIFPLLYDFARLSIARSVVLIDELELHLHPPQQQALLSALRRIGPDCQFIVTTHSPYLEEITPDEDELRLPGGRPCL